jgi:hypothetical protein
MVEMEASDINQSMRSVAKAFIDVVGCRQRREDVHVEGRMSPMGVEGREVVSELNAELQKLNLLRGEFSDRRGEFSCPSGEFSK